MEFLQEVFVRYWRKVVVAMLLTATLPFFRRHVRRLRAKVIAFFTVRKRREAALLEAEKWRKKSDEAEQKYLAETEEKHKAVDEAEHLQATLSQPKQEQIPETLTAKLLELLRACEKLHYPTNTRQFLYVSPELRRFLPAESEFLRMKVMGAVNSYISASHHGSLFDKDTKNAMDKVMERANLYFIERKCTVFLVMMLIAQGVSENLITIDDSKKLTWKRAGELLDKVNDEYFKEHPEVSRPSKDTIREAQHIIADAFGRFPPEAILEDKEFIQAILPSTKPVAAELNKSKGFLGRLFG